MALFAKFRVNGTIDLMRNSRLTLGHLYQFKVSGRRGASPALGSG